jgi:hypothetical protein
VLSCRSHREKSCRACSEEVLTNYPVGCSLYPFVDTGRVFLTFPVPERIDIPYRSGMGENRRTTYRISEAARVQGISIEG